jgi:hypothetical protein
MFCWRISLKKQRARYADGELAADETARFEAHLLDCPPCRASVVRLKRGRSHARLLERRRPRRDGWAAIAAALDADPAPARGPRLRLPAVPRPALVAVAAAALSLNALGIAWTSGGLSPQRPEDFDPGRFRAVRIEEMGENTEPHVVAEGVVSEVRVDPKDGDVKFRLVESLGAPEPFVVCEVIGPYRVEAPRVGSRVRVFGVSRFDAKETHRWHEIHPVLKVELLDNDTALATSPHGARP